MHRSIAALVIALAIVTNAVTAWAADTGTVSGGVFDQTGAPLSDVTVTIAGSRLPLARTVQTGANGIYRFQYLLPGDYVVEVDLPGVGRSRRVAVVDVGRDTQVDLVVGLVIDEAIVVSAARPQIDLRSSEVAFNVKAETFEVLPLERTYRGLFQLIPGVADNRSSIGPAAGGGRQENTYLIDGANITSPSFGYLSTEINELDIAEVNIKRAGITAEFGRTSGAVTNVVSRSGSNQLAGMGRVDWRPEQLIAAYALPDDLLGLGVRPGAFRDPLLTTEVASSIGVGGPLVENRAFFYGSARYFRQTKWDRINKAGTPLPDEVRAGAELYGKLTTSLTAAQQVTASFRHRPNHVDNNGLTSDFAPTVAVSSDNGSRIGTAEWAYFATPRTSLNLRYLHMRENNEDVPTVQLEYLPPFDPANLQAMGQFTDPANANLIVGARQFTSIQNYRRHEIRGVASHFFDVGSSSHALKIGAGYEFTEETFSRIANGWGAITAITQSGVPALRARYFTPQPPQLGRGGTYSIFVQDDVALGRRTSVNAGVLANRDDFSQTVRGSGGCPSTVILTGGAAVYESSGDTCTFLRFGFADEIQPRLGISVQVREGRSDKAYAHWGRYYNMDQKSTARSLAPSRIFQTQTIFGLDGAVLSSAPLASTTGKMIDPDIEPTYTDEFLVGYATPFAGLYTADVFFMARRTRNFIEDVPSRIAGPAPDAGPFVAANLPCAAFAACQAADARRTYRAVTVAVRRHLAGRWMTDVNYTWSRFAGNFDLDFSTFAVFNTSSILQDGPGTNVEDPHRSGPLFEDRPHVLKVFGAYTVSSRATISGYLRVQSGTPWAARARDWAGAVLNYLEPAGTHRNPVWSNLDLLGVYRLPVQGPVTVALEARLLNAFNNQPRVSTDAQQFLDLQTIPVPPYFAPYREPNPFFGTGNAFAPPRRLHLAASISF